MNTDKPLRFLTKNCHVHCHLWNFMDKPLPFLDKPLPFLLSIHCHWQTMEIEFAHWWYWCQLPAQISSLYFGPKEHRASWAVYVIVSRACGEADVRQNWRTLLHTVPQAELQAMKDGHGVLLELTSWCQALWLKHTQNMGCFLAKICHFFRTLCSYCANDHDGLTKFSTNNLKCSDSG